MKTELLPFTGDENTPLPGILWLPEGRPRLVLQVVHGMTEHMGRYEALAEKLTAEGIAVAGFDLRGHGQNPDAPLERPRLGCTRCGSLGSHDRCASFGRDGWACSLEDMRIFRGILTGRFPGIPLVLLGFSLGSFLVRDLLHFYDDPVDGVVLMGTGCQSAAALAMAKLVAKDQIRKAGFNSTTPMVDHLTFQSYNSKFAPNRTPADWLCSDPAQVDAYLADPLCRRSISAGLFWQLLDSMQRTGSPRTYEKWARKDLPVLLLSGGEDPVGGFGKDVTQVAETMKKAGLTRVELHLFPGCRHDILHETESGSDEKVLEKLLDFLNLI